MVSSQVVIIDAGEVETDHLLTEVLGDQVHHRCHVAAVGGGEDDAGVDTRNIQINQHGVERGLSPASQIHQELGVEHLFTGEL